MRRLLSIMIAIAIGGCADGTSATTNQCPPTSGIALQILGSGGPIADDARASSGYIVWLDGKSRVLIDVGGGTFLRFGEANASFRDLAFIGLSHFHTDHSTDFPALLKSGYFSGRERPLVVAGPDGGGPFPGLDAYLSSILEPDTGAYGYLSGYLDGSGGLVRIVASTVSDADEGVNVLSDDGRDIRIDAMHVPHGIVPALAFRVRIDGKTLVFASDQNGSDPSFIDFAKDADMLVMHMTIPESATGGALQLHAKPSRIGEIADAANADTLLLSHFMARSLRDLDGNVAHVERAFSGTISLASDLACLVVN